MQIMEPFTKKTLCPYCNAEIQLRKCKIVSGKDRTTVLFDPKPLSMFPRSIVGRSMTRELAARQCPQCKELLPRNFESVDRNIPIAILGGTFSGKSHYIAALIEQLRSGKFVPSGHELCLLNPADTEVEKIYQSDYYQPLFQQNLKLPRSANFYDLDAKPLIYELTIEGQTRKVVNLLIYDICGEDIVNVDNFVSFRPHLLNAKGILFMADPWAIPGFSKKLAHHLRPKDDQIDRVATNLLHSIIELFRDYAGQDRKTRFKTPTALVITKADLIPFLNIDPYYQDLFNPDFADRLDIDSNSHINDIIQQFLYSLNESGLVNMAKQLEYTRFFVTSATGSNLDESTDTFPFIRPYRCLDPLFWLLREIGVLD